MKGSTSMEALCCVECLSGSGMDGIITYLAIHAGSLINKVRYMYLPSRSIVGNHTCSEGLRTLCVSMSMTSILPHPIFIGHLALLSILPPCLSVQSLMTCETIGSELIQSPPHDAPREHTEVSLG